MREFITVLGRAEGRWVTTAFDSIPLFNSNFEKSDGFFLLKREPGTINYTIQRTLPVNLRDWEEGVKVLCKLGEL